MPYVSFSIHSRKQEIYTQFRWQLDITTRSPPSLFFFLIDNLESPPPPRRPLGEFLYTLSTRSFYNNFSWQLLRSSLRVIRVAHSLFKQPPG